MYKFVYKVGTRFPPPAEVHSVRTPLAAFPTAGWTDGWAPLLVGIGGSVVVDVVQSAAVAFWPTLPVSRLWIGLPSSPVQSVGWRLG